MSRTRSLTRSFIDGSAAVLFLTSVAFAVLAAWPLIWDTLKRSTARVR
jgi:hypothetical protein